MLFFFYRAPFIPEIEGAPCFPDGSKLYGGEALRDWEPELLVLGTGNHSDQCGIGV